MTLTLDCSSMTMAMMMMISSFFFPFCFKFVVDLLRLCFLVDYAQFSHEQFMSWLMNRSTYTITDVLINSGL